MEEIIMANRLISLVEASELAGVSVDTVRRHVKNGVIPGYKMGRTNGAVLRVYLDDMTAWIESCRVSPNDEG